MQNTGPKTLHRSLETITFEKALKSLLQSTAGQLGEEFLQGLVKELCRTLDLHGAFIARWGDKKSKQLQTVTAFFDNQKVQNFQFDIGGSFSERVCAERNYCITADVTRICPRDLLLKRLKASGCIGVALMDSQNRNIGVLVGYSHVRLDDVPLVNSVLDVFAFRVSSELERQTITEHLRNEVVINQTQLDSVPALMFMLSKEGKFLRWNQYFKSKFGYTHKEMTQEHILMAVHESDHKRIELEIEAVFATGSGSVYLNGVTKHGDIVPLLATAEATLYQGDPVIVGVALDMTEQQNVERNLLRSQGRLARKNSQLSLINTLVERLHSSHSVKLIAEEVVGILRTLQSSSTIVFSAVKPSGDEMEIIASNGVSERLLELRRNFPINQVGSPSGIAFESKRLEIFESVANDPRLAPHLRDAFVEEGIKAGAVLPLIYKGEPLGSIAIGYKYQSEIPEDELEFYQTIGSSISLALANARQYKLMEELATIDTLTSLPNRNALNEDCEISLKRIKHNDLHVGLILVDLDRFKEINDTLDHQIGDELLKLIGPRIEESLKDADCQIYRLGGDEFCVLVSNKESAQQIFNITNEIESAIANPFIVDGLNLEISSSIGVVTTQGIHHSAAEMLRCAELAMYHAKNEGGGIARYTPELDADTNQRFVIMAEMAEAIRNDDLVLHFQPKFDLKTHSIIGSEALVRWEHPKYGLLPPAKFIPLVELTQLINPLTYWVLKNAIAQLALWKKQGIDISMAVNLSTRNLTDDDFMIQVDRLIDEFQIDPAELEFEVTETALMSNLDRAERQLREFSKRGIQCSLDDYGTGYSSLTYIKKLPLDILKIDRSFISQMLEDNEDRIIAKSTINLAHNLGLKVIAEGVENENTLIELAEQGCDFIQGYYISKPLDAESFARLYWEHSG